MLRVRYSSVITFFILIATGLSLGFLLMTPLASYGTRRIRAIVAVIGFILYMLISFCLKKDKSYLNRVNVAKKYMSVYFLIIIYSALYTILEYDYNIWDSIVALTPYIYILYSIPLLYVMNKKADLYIFGKVAWLELFIIIFKLIGWYLYNFKGIVVYENLTFEFGNWFRNGLLRMEPGCLFGITYVYFFDKAIHNKRWINKVIVLCMFLFSIVLTQFRYLVITLGVVSFVMIFYKETKNSKKVLLLRLATIFIVIVVIVIAAPDLLRSFGKDGSLYGSTEARLINLITFGKKMKNENAWFGLGLLEEINENARLVLARSGTSTINYLDDVGIVGGIIRFGMLAVPMYGIIIINAIRACKKVIKYKSREGLFIIGCCTYMSFSCLLFNIFDQQRAFAVPFYVAIISNALDKNTCNDSTDEASHKMKV